MAYGPMNPRPNRLVPSPNPEYNSQQGLITPTVPQIGSVHLPQGAVPGMPAAPELMSAYDDDGQLKQEFQFGDWKPEYELQYDPSGQAQWGLDEMKSRSSGTAWEDMMSQQADMSALDQKEQAYGAMQGQLAGARTQLQMRGGMGGGARERLAASGAQAVADQQAAIGRQTQLAKLGIGAQAQDRRDNMLGAYQSSLSGHLGQQAAADQYNAAGRLGFHKGRLGYLSGMMGMENQQQLGQYQQAGNIYGAEQTADAIAASAPKPKRGLLGWGSAIL